MFYAFDLLHLDGRNLQTEPLSARQALLAEVINDSGLRLCIALPGAGKDVIRAVRNAQFEGVVAKLRESKYRSGDHADWQKKQFKMRQEFVIGGYRPDGRDSIGSLLVGVYEDGELKFVSKVRPGLDRFNRRKLRVHLQPLNNSRCPFVNLPTAYKSRGKKSSWDSGGVSADEMANMQWVRPRLVAEIRFLRWTTAGLLRHPAFVALRDDKSAKEVVREL